MKSVKPGRGPSFMGGAMNVAVAIIGIIWTAAAGSIDDSGVFTAFGVVFVIVAVAGAIYNFSNAAGKNRFSEFDITEPGEEPDPLNERFGAQTDISPADDSNKALYCPYCGQKADEDHQFCKRCGRKLAKE